MKTHINIQIRLMAIAIFSVLITGLSSLYMLDSVQRAENKASREQQQLLIAALALEEAHTQFKIQVQEWKNLLLRGRDADAYQKYFASFNHQTDEVQKRLTEAQTAFKGTQHEQFEGLIANHKKLVEIYLKTLDTAKLDNPESVETIDKSLRGIDRPLDAVFPELTKHLAQAAKNKLSEDNALHTAAHRKHAWWISICVSISATLIAVSFWISIKTQANHKITP